MGELASSKSPGSRPLSKMTPMQPTRAKAKAIGISKAINKIKAARPIRQMASADNLFYSFQRRYHVHQLDDHLQAHKESAHRHKDVEGNGSNLKIGQNPVF